MHGSPSYLAPGIWNAGNWVGIGADACKSFIFGSGNMECWELGRYWGRCMEDLHIWVWEYGVTHSGGLLIAHSAGADYDGGCWGCTPPHTSHWLLLVFTTSGHRSVTVFTRYAN